MSRTERPGERDTLTLLASKARGRFDITAWSDSAKVLFVSATTLPFAAGWMLRLLAIRDAPSMSTYVSRAYLPTMVAFTAMQTGAHVLLVILALAMRRRGPRVPWLVHAEAQLWFGCLAFSLYALGTLTSSMSVMLLVLPVVGYLLFDRRAIHYGLVTGTIGIALGVALPALGIVRYAPFLAHAPYHDGKLEPAWVFSQGVPMLFGTAVGIAVFTTLLRRLHERQRELERLSSTDMLTGLPNRRVFFERLDEELSRASRYDHALCVLMVDVDHFKAVNDTHGHLVGDEVLRKLGTKIQDARRLGDVASRYGGEELAILLPHTGLEGARAVAERMLRLARAIDVGDGTHITVSVGIAEREDADTSATLLARADAALYTAKRAGRDRACTASPAESGDEVRAISGGAPKSVARRS